MIPSWVSSRPINEEVSFASVASFWVASPFVQAPIKAIFARKSWLAATWIATFGIPLIAVVTASGPFEPCENKDFARALQADFEGMTPLSNVVVACSKAKKAFPGVLR